MSPILLAPLIPAQGRAQRSTGTQHRRDVTRGAACRLNAARDVAAAVGRSRRGEKPEFGIGDQMQDRRQYLHSDLRPIEVRLAQPDSDELFRRDS